MKYARVLTNSVELLDVAINKSLENMLKIFVSQILMIFFIRKPFLFFLSEPQFS